MKWKAKCHKQINYKFDSAHHRRISKYFHLYTQFLNYGTLMYVAHRNFVSVFDPKNKTTEIYHLRFDDEVVNLA